MSDVPVSDPVQKSASPASDWDKALRAAQVLVNVEYDSEPGGVPAEAIARLILEKQAEEAERCAHEVHQYTGCRDRAADLRRQASQGSRIGG